MPAGRPRSIVAHPAQWLHCAHAGTALLPGGGVQLSWQDAPADPCARPPGEPGGLVFDAWCVGYRSDPARGAVLAVAPGASRTPGCPGAYVRPRGLAVDGARRLYVADPGSQTSW